MYCCDIGKKKMSRKRKRQVRRKEAQKYRGGVQEGDGEKEKY